MSTFILAQIILGLPGAVVSLLILILIPDMPLLFIAISHVVQSVLIIYISISFGPAIMKWLGISDKTS